MSYPDDKETFEKRVTGDLVPASDRNDVADFLERLQDVLGLGIRLGYASVKFLLDYLKTEADKVADKFDKTGGKITGNLEIERVDPELKLSETNWSKNIRLICSSSLGEAYLLTPEGTDFSIADFENNTFMTFNAAGNNTNIRANVTLEGYIEFPSSKQVSNLVMPQTDGCAATDGGIRFNEGTNKLEIYYSGSWHALSEV